MTASPVISHLLLMLLSLLVGATAWAANQHLTQRVCVRSTSMSVMSAEATARMKWLVRNKPAWSPPGGFTGLSSMAAAVGHTDESASTDFVHAPLSFFALDRLVAKGTRRSQGGAVDIGEPEDFSRPLAKDSEGKVQQWSGASVGSWACTAGGWDSPKLRPTTETFLVLHGEGSVTDADGMPHPFGAGDVVVLPKQWHGRWDITADIHKVWVVHDHPDVVGAANGVVRAVVAPVPSVAALPARVVQQALHEAPANAVQTIYDVGPTRVGFMSCSPGSFVVAARPTAECFFVVDGVFFLTNVDGSARRCTAGDTVVLPSGWAGHWNIVEPVRKVWVQVGPRG